MAIVVPISSLERYCAGILREPSLPKGVKVNALNPCNYLTDFLLDGSCICKCPGRCKHLDTSVLDGRDGEIQSNDVICTHAHIAHMIYAELVMESRQCLKTSHRSNFICLCQ